MQRVGGGGLGEARIHWFVSETSCDRRAPAAAARLSFGTAPAASRESADAAGCSLRDGLVCAALESIDMDNEQLDITS